MRHRTVSALVPALLLSAVFGLLTPSLWAVRGRVVSQEGLPIIDALVTLIGTTGASRTDKNGNFTWEPDPKPPFEVLVVLSDGRYMNPVLVTALPEGEEILIITVAPVTSDTVTVSAGATPHIDAPIASGTAIVTRSELESETPLRLVDAIDTVAGVNLISEGHAAVPAVRGLARGRTLVMIDGGRVTTERRVGPSATFLDPFFLEGVEIARGPGSVAYGSDAIGGVIHARTRTPSPGTPFRFEFKGLLGAGIEQQDLGVRLSQGFQHGGIMAQGAFRQFGDYSSPFGTVPNTSAKNLSFQARAAYEVGQGRIDVGFQTDQGTDIGRPRTDSNTNRFSYPEEDSNRFNLGYELDPWAGFSRTSLSFFLGSYDLLTRRERLPTSSRGRIHEDADVSANDWGARALLVRPLKRARFEFGYDGFGRFDLHAVDRVETFDQQDNSTGVASNITIDDAQKSEHSVFGNLEIQLHQLWTLSGGLRVSALSARNRGGFFGDHDRSDGVASGFAALSVAPADNFSLNFQISRGFRDPSLSDRYFRGVSGRGFITGNPELEPEKTIQFDFSGRYRWREIRFGVFAYSYEIKDLIERYEAEPDFFYFRNRDSARINGFELETSWEMKGWDFSLTGQLARGESSGDQAPLDDMPPPTLNLILYRPLFEKGFLRFRATAYARDDRPGPTEITTPGHGVFDMSGGWRFGEHLRLQGQIRNLFDKDFPVSPDSRAVVAPGRNGSVTLSVLY